MKAMCVAILIVVASVPARCGQKSPLNELSDIEMKIGALSPVEVGVVTPGNKFILMRSEDFSCQGLVVKDGQLKIDPSRATGHYWNDDGERSEMGVFSEVGVYTIIAADNLETELDNSLSITKKYRNKQIIKTVAFNSCKTHDARRSLRS